MEADEMVISVHQYKKLLDEVKFLEALQDAGVDNWDGYDYALEIYQAFK